MKIRESGMPDESMWETFFHPEQLLSQLHMDSKITNVVEFGCGYGTFTLPVSKIINGTIYAFDIDPTMIQITQNKAQTQHNIHVIQRDLGTGIESRHQDSNERCPVSTMKDLHHIVIESDKVVTF